MRNEIKSTDKGEEGSRFAGKGRVIARVFGASRRGSYLETLIGALDRIKRSKEGKKELENLSKIRIDFSSKFNTTEIEGLDDETKKEIMDIISLIGSNVEYLRKKERISKKDWYLYLDLLNLMGDLIALV